MAERVYSADPFVSPAYHPHERDSSHFISMSKQIQRKKPTGAARKSNRSGAPKTPVRTLAVRRPYVPRTNTTNLSFRGRRGDTVVVVKNVEFISQITVPSGTSQAKANLVLNPGNAELFPWLHSIALNFEEYKIRKLRLMFMSALGSNYRGAVYLGFDPDIKDPLYTSTQQLMTAEYAERGQVHDNIILDIPAHAMDTIGRKRYVAASSTSDRTGDAGRLYAWVDHLDSSISSNILVGDLLVEYEIELAVPQYRVNQLAYEGYSRWKVLIDELSSPDVWKIPFGATNTLESKIGELAAAVGTSWSGNNAYQFINLPKTGAFLIKLARWYQDHYTGSTNVGFSPAVATSDLKDTAGVNLVPVLVDLVMGDSVESTNANLTETWSFTVPEDVYLQNADTGAWGASPASGTRPTFKDAVKLQLVDGNKLAPSPNCDVGMVLETLYTGARAYAAAATTYDVEGRLVRIADDIPARIRTKYLRRMREALKRDDLNKPTEGEPVEFEVVGH